MSINKKVIILISLLFFTISSLFFIVLENRKKTTIAFENSLIKKKVINLNNILEDRLNVLNKISYEYSSLKKKDFNSLENITPKLNLSYFIVLDKEKKVLYSQSYDINSHEFLDTPNDLDELFSKLNFDEVLADKARVRFLTLDYEKLLFSLDRVDDLGYVFVARTIDSTFLSNISSILDSFTFFLPSHDLKNIYTYKNLVYDILRENEDFMYSDIKYEDVVARENFFISLKISRDYYKEITKSNELLITLFIVSSLLLIIIMYIFINKLFTKRISYISKTVKEISKNKNLKQNIKLLYDDEITYLSKKMNEMLSIISDSQNEKIRKERDFLQSVLDSQQHIIFITDGNTIQSANKKFLDIFESSNNFLDNIALLDNETKNKLLRVAKKHSSIDKPAKFKTQKDDLKYFVFDISRVEVQKYIVCMNDVSKVNEKISHLKIKASTDALTSCLNKASLIEYSKYWLDIKSFGMIVLDIDKFKTINDTYGHLCGDIILKDLASLVKSHLQKGDIIGRFGGEEFVLLIDNTNIRNIQSISERLRKIVEDYVFLYEDLKLKITISLGCTICSKNDSYEELFKLADDALYEAKESGRNQVIYKAIAA